MSSATKTKKLVDLWKFYFKDEVDFAAQTWPVSRVLDMMRTGGTRDVKFAKPKGGSMKGIDYLDVSLVGDCYDGTSTVFVRLERDACTEEEIDRLQDIACMLFPKGSGPNYLVRDRIAKAMGREIRNDPKNEA